MDQINLDHENLIHVDMYPKKGGYFVNKETKSKKIHYYSILTKIYHFFTRLFCGRNDTSVYFIIPGTK
jgi:hypothetical protein